MSDNSIIPEYTLRRSARRRTIEIQVRPDSVRVLAPTKVSQSHIDRFLLEKAQWIGIRQQELRLRLPPLAADPVVLDQGSELLWMGERLRLEVEEGGAVTDVILSADTLKLTLSNRIRKNRSEAISAQLERWHREQATLYFNSRVSYWSGQMKLTPSAVVMRSYRRKWGCCNSRGVVSFNWVLMMAPRHIIDYVIVHELSHLKQMNHSPAFWAVVGNDYPEYLDAKKWLNSHGGHLQWPPPQNGSKE